MVIGRVSSGKSSFINSLTNAFVSCVSLNRETFNPILYKLSTNGAQKDAYTISERLLEKHKSNQKERESLSIKTDNQKLLDQMETKYTNIDYSMQDIPLSNIFDYDIDLYDFPGIADAEDNHNLFEKAIENLISIMDIVLFVVDSTRAFIDKEELEKFNKIQKLIEKNINEHSKYTWLGIIINKYDDINDDEVKEIYDKIQNKIKCNNIYRYSSHCVFTTKISKYGIYIPEFMIKEFKKILDHSSIIITEELTEQLSVFNNNNQYFPPTLFKYNKMVNNLLDKYKIFGDWDDLIGTINNIIMNGNNEREKIILNAIERIIKTIPQTKTYVMRCNHSNYLLNKCDHTKYDCRLNYEDNNNKKWENDGKSYNYKCYCNKKYFNCKYEHHNCFEKLKTCDPILYKNDDTLIKQKIDNIISKKQLLNDHNISLEKYHNIIKYHINKLNNILASYLLYITEKELYINEICSYAYTIIYQYFSSSKDLNYDALILYNENITKHFNKNQVLSLLAIPNIWDNVLDNGEKNDMLKLYPDFEKLITIAKMNAKELHVLYYDSLFIRNSIYKHRMILFMNKNINNNRLMKEELFNDSLLSNNEYQKIVDQKNHLDMYDSDL